jgi:hypothetical protein
MATGFGIPSCPAEFSMGENTPLRMPQVGESEAAE